MEKFWLRYGVDHTTEDRYYSIGTEQRGGLGNHKVLHPGGGEGRKGGREGKGKEGREKDRKEVKRKPK